MQDEVDEEFHLPSPPSTSPNLSSSSETGERSLSDFVDLSNNERLPTAQPDNFEDEGSDTSRHTLSRSSSYLYSSASANLPSSLSICDTSENIWPLKEHLNVEHDVYEEDVQWHVLTNLGEGAFGTCYLAKEKNTEKIFCVKKCQYRRDELLPMYLAAKEKVPEIVQFFGAVRTGRNVCIFMEVLGQSVRDIIRENGKRLESPTAFSYFQDVMKALLFIHEKGIVHNDVKGNNVLITENTLNAKLIDFGNATSDQEHSCRDDVWRSGCLLIEMLTAEISPLYTLNPKSITLRNYVNPDNIGRHEFEVMEECFKDNATSYNVLKVVESVLSQRLNKPESKDT